MNNGTNGTMTEKELALALMRAGLMTRQQVRVAAQALEHGESFADLVVRRGYVSRQALLRLDRHALDDVEYAPEHESQNGAHNGTHNGEHEAHHHHLDDESERRLQQRHAARHPMTVTTTGAARREDEWDGHTILSGPDENGDETVATPDEAALVSISGEEDVAATGVNVIINYCNRVLHTAVQLGASDIHLEPRPQGLLARYRVDGHLCSTPDGLVPPQMKAPVISRFKLMANLDIAESRLPQDGRFRATVEDTVLDFRVSSLPSLHGEQVVLRLLNHSSLVPDLSRLGFPDDIRTSFETMLQSSCSMILVTGPTGSGKTTTLYAALTAARDDTKKVVTVEDPIEYEMEGVTQTNVRAKIGLTFATQLRAILRHDPDVIMVGEIRDSETADVAVRAALTGHLVLSTLHTNSAAAAVTRLQDMGVPPFLLASTLSGVLAQRLVRTICRHCRRKVDFDGHEYEKSTARLQLPFGTPLYEGAGCEHCHGTGMSGRIALVEMLSLNRDIRRGIMEKADSDTLRHMAVERGMTTLWQDGLSKMTAGITTADEVARALLGTEDMTSYREAMLHGKLPSQNGHAAGSAK